MDFRTLKLYKFPILLALSCIAFYAAFAYSLERSDFFRLIALYGGLFFLSFKLIQMQKHNFWILAALAMMFRLVFIVAFPGLSQDYFRFIWDGRLIASGWNPFEYTPDELISRADFHIPQMAVLIKGMGDLSAGHYSNYPPLNQLIFAIAGWISSSKILGSVIFFRFIIILADIGTLILGRKLLKSLGLPAHQIFWYILNPFIIIELTGNLHFEGVMVFFLVAALYLLNSGKFLWSAVLFGLSVSLKLLPLMFLPLLFRYFMAEKNKPGFLKLFLYYLITLLIFIISFLAFYSTEVVSNFMNSIGLWFGKFEFNAGIYYLLRWIGFQVKGYNIIESLGRVLPVISTLIILMLSYFRKNENIQEVIKSMLLAVTAYFLLSTTVHPWYLAVPLMLSVFTNMKYMILWSALVMLSYFAYSNLGFEENYWLLALEYLAVCGYLSWELFLKGRGILKP